MHVTPVPVHVKTALGAEADLAPLELLDPADRFVDQQVDLFVIEFGNVMDTPVDRREHALAPHEGEDIGLHDAEVDTAKIKDVGDVLDRTLAEDRQDSQI